MYSRRHKHQDKKAQKRHRIYIKSVTPKNEEPSDSPQTIDNVAGTKKKWKIDEN
jgi:hypothetical protein